MHATRIITNLMVPDVDTAKGFYTDFLGLSTEEFSLGWVARFTSPETGASLQLVSRDATAPEDSPRLTRGSPGPVRATAPTPRRED